MAEPSPNHLLRGAVSYACKVFVAVLQLVEQEFEDELFYEDGPFYVLKCSQRDTQKKLCKHLAQFFNISGFLERNEKLLQRFLMRSCFFTTVFQLSANSTLPFACCRHVPIKWRTLISKTYLTIQPNNTNCFKLRQWSLAILTTRKFLKIEENQRDKMFPRCASQSVPNECVITFLVLPEGVCFIFILKKG